VGWLGSEKMTEILKALITVVNSLLKYEFDFGDIKISLWDFLIFSALISILSYLMYGIAGDKSD
jgi:uncharacterized membrane protein YdjX (TVP38/TMEM64 family)